MTLSDDEVHAFRAAVYRFYRREGRHELAWRLTDDPYWILLSEIMLQQTQVSRVEVRYEEFLGLFPSFGALAAASLRDVLAAWSGLGYNRRARFLHELAGIVVRDYGGRLPEDIPSLRALPGIGEYTAAAVACFAFGAPVAVIETNIRRAIIYSFFSQESGDDTSVFAAEPDGFETRVVAFPERREEFLPREVPAAVHDREVREVADQLLDREYPARWNYALMDYGQALSSLVPNPNRHSAHYTRQSRFEGSRRQVRGAILKVLSSVAFATEQTLADETGFAHGRLHSVLLDLRREGFVETTGVGPSGAEALSAESAGLESAGHDSAGETSAAEKADELQTPAETALQPDSGRRWRIR